MRVVGNFNSIYAILDLDWDEGDQIFACRTVMNLIKSTGDTCSSDLASILKKSLTSFGLKITSGIQVQ